MFLCELLFTSSKTVTRIGDTGARILAEVLEVNTTLKKLYLGCEHKRIK